MRWVAKLFLLGLALALVHRIAAAPQTPLEPRAALALGTLMIAAWAGTELARRTRLPRVTGVLLLGFAVGPAWLNLVRADELAALGFIGDAMLALVALTAGSRLSLEALRPPLARGGRA